MKQLIAVFFVLLLGGSLGFARGSSAGDSGMETEPKMMSPGDEGDGLLMFTDLEAARLLVDQGPVVLFFSADWCPVCRADLQEMRDNPAKLEGITVIVVDYDEETDLKKKYQITYQHTYVQIDPEGEKLAIWNGGGVDGILSNTLRGEM